MEKTSALQVLGLANRANELVLGYDPVLSSIQKNKIKLVLVASDASNKTKDTFSKKCFFYKIEILEVFTSEELSQALGRKVKIVGIKDQGFEKLIKKRIEVK